MTEQKKKLLKAKIAGALYHENGKVPTPEEIDKWTKFAQVLYTAVLYTHRRALHHFFSLSSRSPPETGLLSYGCSIKMMRDYPLCVLGLHFEREVQKKSGQLA